MSMFHFKGKSVEFACDRGELSAVRYTSSYDIPASLNAGAAKTVTSEGRHIRIGEMCVPISEEDFDALMLALEAPAEQFKKCAICGRDMAESDSVPNISVSQVGLDPGHMVATLVHRWCLENSKGA